MFENNDSTERFFAEAEGWDGEALGLGLSWLVRYAIEGGYQRAAISVGKKEQIKRMKPALPEQLAAPLFKHGEIVAEDVSLVLMPRSKRYFEFSDGPILAVWVRDRELEVIDDYRAPAICAITWSEGNIDAWKAAWGPTDLRSGQASAAATVDDPVVVAALESLSATVNLSSGLGHPSDRDAAIDTFKILQGSGHLFQSAAVRAWAASHGWRAEDASELGELAQKVIEGRRLRGGGYLRPEVIEHWREEAAEGGG